MRVFISGGTGFVGGALVRRLAAHELFVPSRNNAGAGGLPFSEDLAGQVAQVRPHVVINLLGIIRETPGASFSLVHQEYTRRLLAGARACGVVKFIQMSALGASPDAPSAYQRSKFAGEEAVRASGLPYAIFRPSFITGPGQKLRAELAAMARFLPLLAAPGDALAAPVSVETVADCFAKAVEDASITGEVFELAGEKTMSFREIFAAELAAAGFRRPVLGLPLAFFRPLLPLFALLPEPPMTREQYLMLKTPNLPSGKYRGVAQLLREPAMK
jgi:NADH dehydrogenase